MLFARSVRRNILYGLEAEDGVPAEQVIMRTFHVPAARADDDNPCATIFVRGCCDLMHVRLAVMNSQGEVKHPIINPFGCTSNRRCLARRTWNALRGWPTRTTSSPPCPRATTRCAPS